MSLRGVIQRPDGGPLGSIAEVKHQLSEAFPGVKFTYEATEPPGLAREDAGKSIFSRLLSSILTVDSEYPRYSGIFQRRTGGLVQFYILPKEPVMKISATSYGMTAGLDDNFDELAAATGWVVKYPRF